MEIEKTTKMKNAEKKRTFWQEQLVRWCSQIVFFLLLCFFKFCIFAENTIKIGVSAKTKNKKKQKINKLYKLRTGPSKYKLKTGPSMLRNKIGPVFNL